MSMIMQAISTNTFEKTRLNTETASLMFIKKIVPISLTTLLKNRMIYHEQYFKNHSLEDAKYDTLDANLIKNDRELMIFNEKLQHVSEQLGRKYLQTICLAFVEEGNNQPIEQYIFTVHYPEDGSPRAAEMFELTAKGVSLDFFKQLNKLKLSYMNVPEFVKPRIAYIPSDSVPRPVLKNIVYKECPLDLPLIERKSVASLDTTFHKVTVNMVQYPKKRPEKSHFGANEDESRVNRAKTADNVEEDVQEMPILRGAQENIEENIEGNASVISRPSDKELHKERLKEAHWQSDVKTLFANATKRLNENAQPMDVNLMQNDDSEIMNTNENTEDFHTAPPEVIDTPQESQEPRNLSPVIGAESASSPEEISIYCQCKLNQKRFNLEIVQCDNCTYYEHCVCAGYTDRKSVRRPHNCYKCKLANNIEDPYLKDLSRKDAVLLCHTRIYLHLSVYSSSCEQFLDELPAKFAGMLKSHLEALGFPLDHASKDLLHSLGLNHRYFFNIGDVEDSQVLPVTAGSQLL